MIYAVNLADAMYADFAIKLLISPVLDTETIVNAEPGMFDGMASPLKCDEERAKAIVGIIRLKVKKHQLRLYESSTGKGWKRI